MRRGKLISSLTFMVGIMMISIGMVMQQGNDFTALKTTTTKFDIKNIAASANMIVKTDNKKSENTENLLLTDVVMVTAPAAVIVPPRVEVFEGMTLEEIAAQL